MSIDRVKKMHESGHHHECAGPCNPAWIGRARDAEMEAVRGIDMMGARNWSEEDKVDIFMAIFHPDRINDLKEKDA